MFETSSATPYMPATAGGQWMTGAPSVAANLISPTETVTGSFTRITDNCQVFEGVQQWDSIAGPSPITLTSSLQDAQATYNGSNYVFSGLVGGPVFAATDNLVVTFPDATAATVTVTVPAPPAINDAGTHMGAPNGLATTFRVPDGQFDVITVFATVIAQTPGQSGVTCNYPADTLALEGTDRVTALIDEATRIEIAARAWQVDMLFVAYNNVVVTTEMFDGIDMPVSAGRMLILNAAEL